MDWAEGIRRAIDYIEAHLTEEIDPAAVARCAACSSFYFQRIFTALCGMTMGEYIRARRLTLAGSELAYSGARVIDVALKYGYESPESFCRAFSRFHGVAPSEAKRMGSRLKSFSRLTVQIILKGGSIMDYRIEDKAAFDILARVETHCIDGEHQRNTIPDFWSRARADGTIDALLAHSTEDHIYGVCFGNGYAESSSFEYGIAARCAADAVAPEGFCRRSIPTRSWAVFSCTGPMPCAIQHLWHEICAEFFPSSAYEPTCEMDIEVYSPGDMTAPDYRCEVWVPVKKKDVPETA